jgi:hypothetical protein
LQGAEDGARESIEFIASRIIRATDRAFDDFAGGARDAARLRRMRAFPPKRRRRRSRQ